MTQLLKNKEINLHHHSIFLIIDSHCPSSEAASDSVSSDFSSSMGSFLLSDAIDSVDDPSDSGDSGMVVGGNEEY